jgi:hypothetical protein
MGKVRRGGFVFFGGREITRRGTFMSIETTADRQMGSG